MFHPVCLSVSSSVLLCLSAVRPSISVCPSPCPSVRLSVRSSLSVLLSYPLLSIHRSLACLFVYRFTLFVLPSSSVYPSIFDLYLDLSFCLFITPLYICQLVRCLYIHLSVYPFVCLQVLLFTCMFIHVSIDQSLCPSVFQSVNLVVDLLFFLSICLSVH